VQRVLDATQEHLADPDTKKQGESECLQSLNVLVPERVKADMIKDAWNQPLKIACQGQKICIYSIGKNKRDENGGGDDIKACTEEAGEE
jgi:Tfp pilus assembly protein PilN